MQRRYRVYDVFTTEALAGNPLAIVLDAAGLDDAAMQAVAAEFNLSATVFVLPAENPAHSARVSIFTPKHEMPFAGHPTVGTAVCLASERFGVPGREQDAVIVLEEKIGTVRCGVRLVDRSGFAEFDVPQLPHALPFSPDKGRIAAALGLEDVDLTFENHRPSRWSAGVPYTFVPVRGRDALARATPDTGVFEAAFGKAGVYVYTRETEGHDHAFRARMFAPLFGIAEDPATGAAVSALAGAVQEFDDLRDGLHVAVIEQGFEMGRPSLIRMELDVALGALQVVRIGGHAVKVAEGTLFTPR